MPIQINSDLKPKENSLIVCAGTITCKTVDGMGSGFIVFKDMFDQNIHHEEKSGGWKEELQTLLDLYHQKKQEMPAYVRIAKKAGFIGGVATVPVRSNKGSNLKFLEEPSLEELKNQYREAVKQAVLDALQLKRPLFIQPLGIGVYGWDPEEAAKLFAEAIEEADPQNQLDISIPLHQTSPGSNDQLFKEELLNLLSKRTTKKKQSIVYFDWALSELEKQVTNLNKRKEKIAAEAANRVYTKIVDLKKQWLNGEITDNDFKEGCEQSINNALAPKSPLANNRGFEKIFNTLLNAGLAIVTLGIANKLTGRFRVIEPTTPESINKLTLLQTSLFYSPLNITPKSFIGNEVIPTGKWAVSLVQKKDGSHVLFIEGVNKHRRHLLSQFEFVLASNRLNEPHFEEGVINDWLEYGRENMEESVHKTVLVDSDTVSKIFSVVKGKGDASAKIKKAAAEKGGADEKTIGISAIQTLLKHANVALPEDFQPVVWEESPNQYNPNF